MFCILMYEDLIPDTGWDGSGLDGLSKNVWFFNMKYQKKKDK